MLDSHQQVLWGFGEFLLRTNARREPIVNWNRPCNPIPVQLANPRVTWLTAWRLSRPLRNFCDTTCSSFPRSMPFVLLCLNYPPLKGSADSLLRWNLRRETKNQTSRGGFHIASGLPFMATRYMDIGSTAPWV